MNVHRPKNNDIGIAAAYLDDLHIPYHIIAHSALPLEADRAAEHVNTIPSNAVKALVVKVENSHYVLAAIRGNDRLSYKKLKTIVGSHNLRLASLDEVLRVTGLPIGIIPPFGGVFGIDTIMDHSIFLNTYIVCGSGSRTATLKIDAAHLKSLPGIQIAAIAA